jgi:diguanylate cyclase (GGDEF)-like protein
MGDQVIIGVAGCLTTQLRDADHIARYGGEEFAVILPETQLKDACLVAERLRKAVEDLTFSHNDKSVCCTMSFGAAELPLGAGISSAELISNADSALYEAKEQGRNRYCAFD